MQANHLKILQLLSRIRNCDDCCASCRALAIELLEGPDSLELDQCEHCRFPKLRGLPCPCEQYIGQPPNPSSERFKEASRA